MAQEPAGGELSEIEFSVPSMVCDGCADKVRRKLTALPGVEAVKPGSGGSACGCVSTPRRSRMR